MRLPSVVKCEATFFCIPVWDDWGGTEMLTMTKRRRRAEGEAENGGAYAVFPEKSSFR